MTTPINLNKFRKAKARTEKAQQAKENRARFGRRKTDKQLDKSLADKLTRHTDGHQLKDDPKR